MPQAARTLSSLKPHLRPYDFRLSAARRGYDSKWQRYRAWYLKKHPLCVDCEKRNEVILATEVHHIKELKDFPELKYVESNLEGLCKTDHNRRKAKERR